MKSIPIPQSYKNRVLASLPAHEIDRLAPHLTPVTLKVNRNLHDAAKMIETVYFLEDGVSSVVVTMENGTTVEVGLIGRDGAVGLPAVLGSGRSPNHTFIQIPGYGFSVKAKVLREQSEASSELRSWLQKAVQSYLVQTAQTARVIACTSFMNVWLGG